jgi:hypothetical protein
MVAAPKFSAGDRTVLAKSNNPGCLATNDGMLELTPSSFGAENIIASPGPCPEGWASVEQAAASATLAGSSHLVTFEKLKPISNRQVSLLDNLRQN